MYGFGAASQAGIEAWRGEAKGGAPGDGRSGEAVAEGAFQG